jgi:hypothetical protein
MSVNFGTVKPMAESGATLVGKQVQPWVFRVKGGGGSWGEDGGGSGSSGSGAGAGGGGGGGGAEDIAAFRASSPTWPCTWPPAMCRLG